MFFKIQGTLFSNLITLISSVINTLIGQKYEEIKKSFIFFLRVPGYLLSNLMNLN